MDTARYSGICIGGPLAGEFLQHLAPEYLVPMPVSYDPALAFSAPDIKVYTYVWHQWHHATTGPFGLWAARDTEVFQVLLDSYVAVHRPLLEPCHAND